MQSEKRQTTASSIAVIGGGIAGATAAVHFAELGLNVTLIEKEQLSIRAADLSFARWWKFIQRSQPSNVWSY